MKYKVLILYNKLFHYRVPTWNILAKKYDLTVAYCQEDKVEEELFFKTIQLQSKSWKRIVVQKEDIFSLCQNYDAVIAYGDIAWLKYSTLPWHPRRKFKIAFWSIGVSASYNKQYDSVTIWDSVRDYFYKKADALIFYSDYPIDKYVNRGFPKERLFVAPNTIAVEDEPFGIDRDNILFVGTLYKAKGIDVLLEAYSEVYNSNEQVPDLDIIGNGPEYTSVKEWIKSHELGGKIHMHGAIYDRKEKANFFRRSIACISPTQAGLTVLESMGYGTPFVTSRTSITGGEIFNIQNDVNGILLQDPSDLKNVLFDIIDNRNKYIEMGKNAYEHYHKHRKPEDMANGLAEAIEYMMKL